MTLANQAGKSNRLNSITCVRLGSCIVLESAADLRTGYLKLFDTARHLLHAVLLNHSAQLFVHLMHCTPDILCGKCFSVSHARLQLKQFRCQR